METVRLEKFIAESGVASRRDAKAYIQAGRVTVNGQPVVAPGAHIQPEQDEIRFDGRLIKDKPRSIYLMLNKPPGYITATRDDRGRKTVMDLVRDISERIYPVGRLDLDTEGLLLMTNDGVFARRISHPSSEIKKTYIAWVTGQLTPQAIEQLRRGVEIEGGVTAPALIAQIGREKGLTQFKLVIHEGKKRQIRRMFHAIGYETVYLKRTGIGSLALGDLPVGQYRFLTPVEVAALMK